MRASKRGFVAALAVLAASCGTAQKAASPATTTSAATSVVATTTTTAGGPGPCSFPADTVVSAADVVQLEPAGSIQPRPLAPAATQPLGCATVLAGAGGVANLRFSNLAACQFSQDPASTKVAVMRTREPDGALVRIGNGQVVCTTRKAGQRLSLCGQGDIQPDGAVNQIVAICNPDPVFRVTVFGGSAKVSLSSGKTAELGVNQQLEFDPALPFDDPGVSQATVTGGQAKILQIQARQLDVTFRAAPTTTSSTATTTPLIG